MREAIHPKNDDQKQIIERLNLLTGRHSLWQVWQDFIIMSACAIASCLPDKNREKREEEYKQRASRYKPKELTLFSECLAVVIKSLERNPEQDFLGELFMVLGLGNKWEGQFFTPYTICRIMAGMTYNNDMKEKAKDHRWISVGDPTCGAGATLLAFANECRRNDFDDQTHVLYIAQDIDFLAGCMCYIQLSLMGCAGYVVIDSSIHHPATSIDRWGLIPVDKGNVWYTPMYFQDIWQMRIFWAKIGLPIQPEEEEEFVPPNDDQD